jgi:hypothetical protein
MKRIAAIAIAAIALGSFGVSSEAFAAKNDAYAQKKAECKRGQGEALWHSLSKA